MNYHFVNTYVLLCIICNYIFLFCKLCIYQINICISTRKIISQIDIWYHFILKYINLCSYVFKYNDNYTSNLKSCIFCDHFLGFKNRPFLYFLKYFWWQRRVQMNKSTDPLQLCEGSISFAQKWSIQSQNATILLFCRLFWNLIKARSSKHAKHEQK